MKLHKSSASGVALVIVLGFLVIISALAVAFFSSVTTELKASRNFASGVSTRQLADSAVQTVMGQIHDATSRKSGCWASQPGMIRVYRTDDTTPSANADAFFKLYSSRNMVETNGTLGSFDAVNFTGGSNPDVNPNWASNPAYWTDLNAPVLVTNPAQPAGKKIARFPIIDPSVNPTGVAGAGLVDGLSFNGAAVGATPLAGAVQDDGSTPATSLPMPVQWIYVLQDGSLVAPDDSGRLGAGTTATFKGTIAPIQTNPIVGRIAFWADDETSKLNINTAAGYMPNQPPNSSYNDTNYAGSFWDTPRFNTTFDLGQPDANGMPIVTGGGGLAICQLLQNEFQRYPGHPATTSLSPVFGKLMTSDSLYDILPRYSHWNMLGPGNSGSSEGGTWRIVTGNTPNGFFPDTFQVLPKPDRLYASVDELLWSVKHNAASSDPSYTRMTNNDANALTVITPAFLDKVRFFLTTQSRAPELNVFGQPRVSIWPIRYQTSAEGSKTTTNGLNAFDNTILFCSSIGQPSNPTTPPDTTTVPPTGSPIAPASPGGVLPFRYIFTRRELPATTGSAGSNTLPTFTADIALPRNAQLLTYLQNMTSRPIPGFGTTFLNSKYKVDDLNSILAEIFDYIRCANAIDTTTTATGQRNPKPFAPMGTIMPTVATLTGSTVPNHGMGRFPTVSEASLVFYYAGPRPDPDPKNPGKILTDGASGAGFPTYRRIRAFLMFSTFDPMQGYAPTSDPTSTSPLMQFSVTGLDKMWLTTYLDVAGKNAGSIQNKPVFSTTSGAYTAKAGTWSTRVYRASGGAWGGRNYGGYEGFMHTLMGQYNPVSNATATWAPQKIARAIGGTTAMPTYPLTVSDSTVASGTSTNGNFTYQEFYELQSPDPDIYTDAEIAVKEGTPLDPVTKMPTLPQNVWENYFGISSADGAGKPIAVTVSVTYGGLPIQTLTLNFPATLDPNAPYTPQAWPIPQGDPGVTFDPANKSNNDPSFWLTNANYAGATSGMYAGMRSCYWEGNGSFYSSYKRSATLPKNASYQTRLQAAWSLAGRISWSMQGSWDPLQDNKTPPTIINWYGNRWRNIVQPGDTIRSLVYCQTPGSDATTKKPAVAPTNKGDMRLAGLQNTVPDYYPHPEYYTNYSRACLLRVGGGTPYFPPGNVGTDSSGNRVFAPIGPVPAPTGTTDVTAAEYADSGWGNHISLSGSPPKVAGPAKFPASSAFGNLPYSARGPQPDGTLVEHGGVNGVVLAASTQTNQLWGDFDTGIGSNPDGPFGNKPDEGNLVYAWQDKTTGIWYYPIPYFSGTWEYTAPGNTYTSPCRQMPSPGMFGSLPSKPNTKITNADGSISTGEGWTTLCFCPNPAAGSSHPGNVDPKDHLLLDFFQMPVVEPYPISEPFSTAGKVNLNYKIAPFGYITRSTALRGVLTPTRVSAVSGKVNGSWTDDYLCYKAGARDSNGVPTGKPFAPSTPYRKRVDLDETIKSFEAFFALGVGNPSAGFFKTASQICEMYLYPQGTPYGTDMAQWWSTYSLTGDNVREKPYVDLYNRLTTKSNTYTVHMRVQTLRQLPRSNGDYSSWNEGKDAVLGEYRGSSTIERYIDPADRRFNPNDSVTSTKKDGVNPDTQSVEGIYRFRTVINKKFP